MTNEKPALPEPDWEALDQMQFLLMRRVTEPLNATLAAVELIDCDADPDRPPDYWRQRASRETLGVLNLVTAWQALIRYKLGESLPQQHIAHFHVQDVMDWLTYHLQPVSPMRAVENRILEANQPSLQEALLLLHSALYTLGPNVQLLLQETEDGLWFRMRYGRSGSGPCAQSIPALLGKLSKSWRDAHTAFELRTAADFIALNGSKLHLRATGGMCELLFFIFAAGKRPADPLGSYQVNTPPPPEPDLAIDNLDPLADLRVDETDSTKPLPESDEVSTGSG